MDLKPPQEGFYSEETGHSRNWSLIIEPSNALGGLYLGNCNNAEDLTFFESEKIAAVLDLAGLSNQYAPEVCVRSIKAEDSEYYDLSTVFDECFEYIHEHRTQGRNVFVHCVVGKSRSPAIVVAYLMKTLYMSFEEALGDVQKKRKMAKPNKGFITQLISYGNKLKEKHAGDNKNISNALTE